MSSFFPIIEKGKKKYVNLGKKELYLSNDVFESLKELNYVVYIESINSYFFYVPEGKGIPKNLKVEIPKTAVNKQEYFEDEYIAFQLQREKRYHTIEYRQRIANGISTDLTFVPCDLDNLVYNAKYLYGDKKASASNTVIGFASLKIAELWNQDPKQSKVLKKAKDEWYKDDKVVMKISYLSKNLETDNSLIVENLIYQNFILKMVERGHTPHMMIPLFSYQCKGFDSKQLKLKENKAVKDWTKRVSPNDYDKSSLNVLILEKGNGTDLFGWMEKPHSVQSWMSILFQIIWTLAVFGQYGLVHNDYHAGNTFLEPLEEPIFAIYFLSPTKYFVVPIHYFAKIFDFDRSTVDANPVKIGKKVINAFGAQQLASQSIKSYPVKLFKTKTKNKRFTGKEAKTFQSKTFQKNYRTFKISLETSNVGLKPEELKIENTLLEANLCARVRECNEFNPHADLFYLLWEITNSAPQKLVPPEIKAFIKQIFYQKDSLLYKQYGHRGILCKPKIVARKAICSGSLFLDSRKEMMDPFTVLNSGLFKMFERTLPFYDPAFTLEREYPHLYVMPSLADAEPRFLDRLETQNIKPISFLEQYKAALKS